jgi:dipeptidyl-peptidase 4
MSFSGFIRPMQVAWCVLVCTALGSGRAQGQADAWPRTVAEQSDFRATSRSDQVQQFIDALTARAPHVRRLDFGKTVEGRSLTATIIAQPPVAGPLDPTADPRLVVLLLGNIHSGECDGKEALLMLMRELAQQPEHPWLKQCVLLFVPNYNADGNDRMKKDNRPGQVGPDEGMGQRANAQNLDLNRDFVKLETPECQQLIALANQWDPHIFIDAHTTDGSRHRCALTFDVPHNPAAPARVRDYLRQEMMPEVVRQLDAQQIATCYYGNFNRQYTQWIPYGDEPRYSIEYFGLRGRIAILSESYAYITYEQRIMATRAFLRECLNFAASRASAIRQLLDDTRHEAVAAPNSGALPPTVPIQSEMAAQREKIVIPGFNRVMDANGQMVTTDEPRDYTVESLADFRPTLSVRRPSAYVLLPAAATLVERLRRHGVRLHQLAADEELDVESYQLQSLERASSPYQGHRLTHGQVELRAGRRTAPRGAWIVPLAQPSSALIVQLLEPQSADGFLAWDVFDPPLTANCEYPVWRALREYSRGR